MPKAVRFYKLGGPEVLQIEEVPVRHPEAGEVAIDVAAVGPETDLDEKVELPGRVKSTEDAGSIRV